MKKSLYIAAGLLFCAFSAHNAHALAVTGGITATDGGKEVSIAVTVPGAPTPLLFNPSTGVVIDGQSVATSFAINGWHVQANTKPSGQRFGMAADSNKMYFQDISTIAPTAIAGTNVSTAFAADATWHTM